MNNFTIIQLCCIDCRHFEKVYFTNFNFIDFIRSLDNYKDFYYIIYDDQILCNEIDGSYL